MIVKKLIDPKYGTEFEEKLLFAKSFIMGKDFCSMPSGRVEIDGDNIFAFVQHYSTADADSIKFENHRVYADLQCIIAGDEAILVCHRDNGGATAIEYDEAGDIEFFDDPEGPVTTLRMSAGDCAVFFPEDYHKTRCNIEAGKPRQICKVIVKIKL